MREMQRLAAGNELLERYAGGSIELPFGKWLWEQIEIVLRDVVLHNCA